MQTPWAKYTHNYKNYLIEVVVEVNSTKAHHFKAKKYLPSQRIIEEKEEGNLVLSFTVTQDLEMMDIVKRWIPHMKVISPLSLKEKIDNEIIDYNKQKV